MHEVNQSEAGSVPPRSSIDPQDTIFQQIRLAEQVASTGDTMSIQRPQFGAAQAPDITELLLAATASHAVNEYWIHEPLHADPAKPFQATLLSRICQIALTQRLLVLRLPAEVPSAPLLRELATTLGAELTAAGGIQPQLLRYDPVVIGSLQEHPSLAALLARQPNTIAIVPCADRRLLGADLVQFARGLVGGETVVLAATHLAGEVLQLGIAEQDHWLDLSSEQCYSQRYLAFELLRGLIERHAMLPPSLRVLRPDAPLAGGRTVQEVALLLRSPLRIQTFLHALDQPGAVAEYSRILAQTARLAVGELIKRWFEQFGRRDQLLALALTMLENLPESDAFTALQALYETIWSLRGPGQPMLDLIDLQPHRTLLAFQEYSEGEPQLNATLDGVRPTLFAVGVGLHRRHLQYAQLWMVRQIRASFQPEDAPINQQRQQSRLRWQYMLALADLARIAPTLVLPALLSLVADPHPEARRLVARALGRWQAQGYGTRLIELVGSWPENPRISAVVNALRAGEAGNAAAIAAAVESLRSVALMCYSEAAASLPAGALPAALIDGFLRLIDTTIEPQVMHTVRDEVLPVLVHTHISQLGSILSTLAQFPALRAELGQNLALVYHTGGDRARAVNQLIQGWLVAGLRRTESHLSHQSEMQLLTAAGVLGAIDYQHGGPIARESAWRYLSLILKQIEHPDSRATVVAACMRLAGQDPNQLRWVLREIRPQERTVVVADLTEVCRQQRAQRSTRRFATWADGTAKSPIEQVLIDWLLSEPRQARTDQAETERLRFLIWETLVAITRRLDVHVAPQLIDDQLYQLYQPSGWYRERLIPALLQQQLNPHTYNLVALFATRVRALAAEEPQVLEAILDRWLADPDLQSLAEGFDILLDLEYAKYWGIQRVGPAKWLRAAWATFA